MQEDQRPYDNQTPQDVPSPKSAGAYIFVSRAAQLLVADTVADPVHPDNRHNTQREPGEDEVDQQIVHRGFVVVPCGHIVNLHRDFGHYYKPVDPQSDDRQKDVLKHSSIGA